MGAYLANDIIATQLVLVHDSDDNGCLSQPLSGDVKDEGLIEDGVQAPLHYHSLLLFHPFVLVHQPHLHVRVWGGDERAQCY